MNIVQSTIALITTLLVGTSPNLLTTPWHLIGSGSAAKASQVITSNSLNNQSSMTITYDLHGLCASGGTYSAIIFDQGGWKYTSLSNYGTNCFNGSQTVTIPLSDFGVDTTKNLDQGGTLHTQFWASGNYTVDISSITLNSNTTPTPTSTPIPTPTPILTTNFFLQTNPNVKAGDRFAVQLYTNSSVEASNLFSARMIFQPNLVQIENIDITNTFVTLWVENNFDNINGKLNIIGAVPNPGFKTLPGSPVLMATANFVATSSGILNIYLNGDSGIYSNSTNKNILNTLGISIPIN